MHDLEEQLIEMCRKEEFDLATAAFIASGITDFGELQRYMADFDRLISDIRGNMAVNNDFCDNSVSSSVNIKKAKAIFDWFWIPERNRYSDDFRFTNVLINQLSGRDGIGDCMGLTILYNSVCQRLNVPVYAVHNSQHVCSALIYEKQTIIIENTYRLGFDCIDFSQRDTIISNYELIQGLLVQLISEYRDIKNYNGAFDAGLIALKIDPETPLPVSLIEPAKNLGNIGLAVDAYKSILESNPASHTTMTELARALQERREDGDLSEAIQYYTQALSCNPANPSNHAALAKALIEYGNPHAAVDSLKKAVDLRPDDFYSLNLLIKTQIDIGDYGAASDILKKVFARDSTNSHIQNRLTGALSYLIDSGDIEQGIGTCRAILENNPSSPVVMKELGMALEKRNERGDLQEAIGLYNEVLSYDPNVYTYILLGAAQLDVGDYPTAVETLRKTVELKPDDVSCQRLLGEALFKMNDYRASADVFLKAHALEPDNSYYHMMRGKAMSAISGACS